MKPIVFGAGFALLGVVDLAWIDLRLAPAALAATERSQPSVAAPGVGALPAPEPAEAPLPAPDPLGAPLQTSEPSQASAPQVPTPAGVPARGQQFTLHFDVNGRTPNDDAASDLDAITALLASNAGLRVNIDGHSDRSGTPNYNDELSRVRAEAVTEALVLRGVERSRIVSTYHGARVPVARGVDAESLARNRRVELHVEKRKP